MSDNEIYIIKQVICILFHHGKIELGTIVGKTYLAIMGYGIFINVAINLNDELKDLGLKIIYGKIEDHDILYLLCTNFFRKII